MTDILPALICLSSAHDEQILLNREQSLQVLARLEKVLGRPQAPHRAENGAPSADPLMGQLQENAANAVSGENHSNNDSRLYETVLRIIKRRLRDIEQYVQQSAKKAVGEAPQQTEDPRIVDAQLYDGAGDRTWVLKFRKALGIRSLGSEFMHYQENRLGYSRVGLQVNELSPTGDTTQDGTIEEFLNARRHISDRRMAASMIKTGTKLLVLERLYGHCGISAILWAAPTWTKLKYSDLPIFLEALSQEPEYANIRMTAEDLDDWYERCQIVYDRKVTAQRLVLSHSARWQSRRTRQTKGRKGGIGKAKKYQKPRYRAKSAGKYIL